jgi:hypothetical protein
MATYKDPTHCFAPLEVIERLLEIRSELGYSKNIYLDRSEELTGCAGRIRFRYLRLFDEEMKS